MRQVLNSLHVNPDTTFHIFDHIMKPILLYASEIWGNSSAPKNKPKNPKRTEDSKVTNTSCQNEPFIKMKYQPYMTK